MASERAYYSPPVPYFVTMFHGAASVDYVLLLSNRSHPLRTAHHPPQRCSVVLEPVRSLFPVARFNCGVHSRALRPGTRQTSLVTSKCFVGPRTSILRKRSAESASYRIRFDAGQERLQVCSSNHESVSNPPFQIRPCNPSCIWAVQPCKGTVKSTVGPKCSPQV